MVSAPIHSQDLDGYQLRLPSFEGPLDVLLRLIEREQLPITEVSLVAVLDQFMAHVESLTITPPSVIAEFATVACRLSLLKSRALLPRPPTIDEDGDVVDLVHRLEEYRRLKLAAAHLAERHDASAFAFGPGDAIAVPPPESPRLEPQPPATLTVAITRWLSRIPRQPTLIRQIPTISLREMVSRIFRALETNRAVSFDGIRSDCANSEEVAVAFLAVLTLLRRRLVKASQVELFGPITIVRQTPEIVFDTHDESAVEGG